LNVELKARVHNKDKESEPVKRLNIRNIIIRCMHRLTHATGRSATINLA